MPPSFARIRRNLIWIFKNIIWFSVGWFFRRTYLQEELPVVILNVKSSNNTRYIDDQLMIIEMAPCKRTVLAYDGPHMLTFPFIYFLIKYEKSYPSKDRICYLFKSLKICFADKQIKSSKGMVGKINISNYYDPDHRSAFNYCLGEGTPLGAYDSLKEVGDSVVSSFWQTEFQMYVDKIWKIYSKANDYNYIINMIFDKVKIKDLMGVKSNVEFKNYKYNEPEPIPTSGIGVNGYKKRIRRKHKQSSSGEA